jgi:hypothetical protein
MRADPFCSPDRAFTSTYSSSGARSNPHSSHSFVLDGLLNPLFVSLRVITDRWGGEASWRRSLVPSGQTFWIMANREVVVNPKSNIPLSASRVP